MKKQINPAVMTAVIICAIGIAVFFLYHASTSKPTYVGDGVGPGGGAPMTKESGQKMMEMMNKAKQVNANR